ncbi:hypothetical protein [Streptomyces sp.]|uniref:hypothetical protein n=1 Tax=Streptomyces sp. TaxID=1931 RepID=UPI0025D2665F|nr:hypothetical protein [Streptomyces sp.]
MMSLDLCLRPFQALYLLSVRYVQGGGLTEGRRAFRGQIRRAAAEGFARGEEKAVITRRLLVHAGSVQRLLSEAEFTEPEDELAKGAAGHGPNDSQWTLDRIGLLMSHQFIVRYTIQGVVALLKTP